MAENQMLMDQMRDTIDDCMRSHVICTDTAAKLMVRGGPNAQYASIMLDCAEMCLTAAHFMQRNSPLHGYTCQACSDVCNHCADVCFQIGEEDCANACQETAQSCAQMVKMVAMPSTGKRTR